MNVYKQTSLIVINRSDMDIDMEDILEYDPLGIIFSSSSSSESESQIVKPRRKKRPVRPYLLERDETGAFTVVFNRIARSDPELFANYTRMSLSNFEELLQMVAPLIIKQTVVKRPMSSEFRLTFILR